MLNLLMIALEFPPIQVAGAFRALRFATQLPKFGIRPIVVSFNPSQFANDTVHVLNRDLANKVPADTPIFFLDVSVLEFNRPRLADSSIGEFRGTHSYSMDELFANVKSHFDIEAVYATCPPFNVRELAIAAKQYFQKPLLLDVRDAWSQWGTAPFRTWFHYRNVLKKEKEMLEAADAVTSVTTQLVDMEWKLTRKPKDSFHWIPNAYDQEKLPSGEVVLEPKKDRYKVAYVGQFYYNAVTETADGNVPWYRKMPHRWLHYHATQQRWIYRTPYFFFRAWKAFREAYPDSRDQFEFHYIGQMQNWLAEMADEFGLSEHCTWHGFKSKQETKVLLDGCDAMLSTSIKVENGEDYCLASKTFDYIVAKKPVLGFVCPGSQRDFLKGANISVLFEPDDSAENSNKLRKITEVGIRQEINHSFLDRFSAIATTEEMAKVIKGLVAKESFEKVAGRLP